MAFGGGQTMMVMMKGLGLGLAHPLTRRPKMNMVLPAAANITTGSSSSSSNSGRTGGDWSTSGGRKTLAGAGAGIGAILALGGLGYGCFTRHAEDNNSKIDYLKQQVKGFSGQVMSIVSNESQASCAPAGKDDCEEKKCDDGSSCLHKMDKEEELIAKANAELEKALKDVKPKAVEASDAALKAYCDATETIKKFMDRAYCAIEEDNLESPRFEEVWCEVYELGVKRCAKVKDAMLKGQCAWELLCRLRELIENGKACKYTQCNPLLLTAEETLLCAERELLNAKAKMDCVHAESNLVEQYRNLVEEFRRDLKAEIDSLLTGAKDCRSTLTDNECTMVLTHAYKKILRVQKELAMVQSAGKGQGQGGQVCAPAASPPQPKTGC